MSDDAEKCHKTAQRYQKSNWPRPLGKRPRQRGEREDQQMQRDDAACRLLRLFIVFVLLYPHLPFSASTLFLATIRKQNTCVANLLRNLCHAHCNTALVIKKNRATLFECSPAQPSTAVIEGGGEGKKASAAKPNSSQTKLWQLR